MSLKRKRIIACEACHKKKVKCSGDGPPCQACAEGDIACSFPDKQKKVRIDQQYLDALILDNKRLSDVVAAGHSSSDTTPASSPAVLREVPVRDDGADKNPILDNEAWFVPVGTVDLPVHIGDAADAAFATRLRQTVSGREIAHLPRVHYMSDDVLYRSIEGSCDWPSAARLRSLVNVALKFTSSRWHIVRKSFVLANVETLVTRPVACNRLMQYQIWALLALGEVYSTRCVVAGAEYPGLKFWCRAMSMGAILPERPHLEVVETHLLLALYASCLNRRHTSIALASTASRICVILGMHLEMGPEQLPDPFMREHRRQLWWTAYRYDRMWSSKIGWPPSVPDDTIEIGLPAMSVVPGSGDDLSDPDYAIAAVKLAGLLNYAISTLYVRRRQAVPFTERVQNAIQSLREWSDTLPVRLHLDYERLPESVSDGLCYLHLAFNQAVIVITRPVLLHMLKQRRGRLGTAAQPLSDAAVSLSQGCIARARQSTKLLKQAWVEDEFHVFDYFFAQFLFSSAIILGLSTLLHEADWQDDRNDFLLARAYLHQLEFVGNFGAREFCNHIDALETVLADELEKVRAGHIVQQVAFGAPDTGAQAITDPAEAPFSDLLSMPNLDFSSIGIDGSMIDWEGLFVPDLQPTQLQ